MPDDMTEDELPYLRLQAGYVGRLGVEVGIFVAVDHLRRQSLLTVEEEERYFDIDDWFQEHLPEPPFYADGNIIGAVTWFKRATTGAMLARLQPLRDLLKTHGVRCDLVRASDPGELVYEDAYQVGIVPRVRKPVTPPPPGVTFGPTTAGSKRHLARRSPKAG
ncbi:hypothetical protein [Nonomuraea zeae]|uniref:Uncharacterized protein n=1 Tax=Nonomuraea zeae TaxID=1642303 RepID=A0A5S4GY42_9ACTN|nr:hypothetical protein [Nonomuraea zeae]TMR37905.1 hypothetical protein ETD85_06695 [Nonomuraea zeae]